MTPQEVQEMRQDLEKIAYDLQAFSAYMRERLAQTQNTLTHTAQALQRQK